MFENNLDHDGSRRFIPPAKDEAGFLAERRDKTIRREMNYTDICLLVYDREHFRPGLSVTYRDRVEKKDGILHLGERITISNGMVFSVADTSNA